MYSVLIGRAYVNIHMPHVVTHIKCIKSDWLVVWLVAQVTKTIYVFDGQMKWWWNFVEKSITLYIRKDVVLLFNKA